MSARVRGRRTGGFNPHAGTYDPFAGKSDEAALYLAVIMQHIDDATSAIPAGMSGLKGASHDLARQEARDWLLEPNPGFEEVCTLAGVEPRDVRKVAIAKIEAFDAKPIRRKAKRREYHSAFGETHSLKEWAAITGINAGTIGSRLRNGLSIAEALSRPIGAHKRKAAQ